MHLKGNPTHNNFGKNRQTWQTNIPPVVLLSAHTFHGGCIPLDKRGFDLEATWVHKMGAVRMFTEVSGAQHGRRRNVYWSEPGAVGMFTVKFCRYLPKLLSVGYLNRELYTSAINTGQRCVIGAKYGMSARTGVGVTYTWVSPKNKMKWEIRI